MARVLIALLVALSIPAAAQAKTVAKPPKPVVGLSDQTPTPFSSPLFAPLRFKTARYVTPWNVALTNTTKLDAWLAAAAGAGVTPLVSFEHSLGDQCPEQPCMLPTDGEYAAAIGAFRARYPAIRTLSPWNEANHKTQPTYKDPLQAAQYWRIVKRLCKGCTIVAADVLDDGNQRRWLTEFSRLAKSARLWGLHNYGDTNRFRTSGIKTMLKTVKGDVWLTETGAIVRFQTAKGLQALRPSEARAAKSMRYLFTKLIPSSKRIKRVYLYDWGSDPANRFDSGLLRPDGSPRATYAIAKKYSAR